MSAPGRHRVALVVFCDAEGVDCQDAASWAEAAVVSALRTSGTSDLPRGVLSALVAYPRGVEATRETAHGVNAVQVMEAGTALRNGYLWACPTGQAWRVVGADDPEEDRG